MNPRDELRAWVKQRDRRPELPLDEHTGIDPQRRAETVTLEEWAQRTISVDEVAPESFATIDAIEKTFL